MQGIWECKQLRESQSNTLIATLNVNNLESFDIGVELGLQHVLMGWNSSLSLFFCFSSFYFETKLSK